MNSLALFETDIITGAEARRLEALEATIERGLNTFVEVGAAFFDHQAPPTRDRFVMTQLLKFLEEVGEFSGALFDGEWKRADLELADVFVTVCSLAYTLDVDLDVLVRAKLDSDAARGALHSQDSAI